MTRLADLERFYTLMDQHSHRLGGRRRLGNLRDHDLPERGVYFFFDDNEPRRDSGDGARVVHVGTHAITGGSRSSLRKRLSHHRGNDSGGGNHRGSIFRLLVGQALLARDPSLSSSTWSVKGDRAKAGSAIDRQSLLAAERSVEEAVSQYLAGLSFSWLAIDDEPGPGSQRRFVKANAIALLSNFERDALDPPSPDWLGHFSDRPLVGGSGLWNQDHVSEAHSHGFLDNLTELIEAGAYRIPKG